MTMNENEDDLLEDEWDDDAELEETAEEEWTPPKKGRGGLFFMLFLLILIGGAGVGYYYIHTPAGQGLRDKIPASILDKLPALPMGTQTADKTPAEKDTAETTTDVSENLDLAMDVPPMPSMEPNDNAFDTSVNITDDQLPSLDTFAESEPVNIEKTQDAGNLDFLSTDSSTETVAEENTASPLDMATTSDNSATEDDLSNMFAEATTDTSASTEREETAEAIAEPIETTTEPTNTFVPVEEATDTTTNVATNTDALNAEPAVKSEDLVNVEDRLSMLEKAVSDIEGKMLTKSDLSGLRSDIKSLRNDVKSAKTHTRKSTSTKATPKKASASRKAAPKKDWVLKAAQPGKAWIAEKGETDSKTVTVGSYVASLGRIKSIQQAPETGRWVVQGTQGSLHQ